MPPKPRWLLAIPDAISQLEKLYRTLLTRRDIERLFDVSTARAATLMQTFGAEMTGYQRTLPGRSSSASSGNTGPDPPSAAKWNVANRLVAELRKARVTGIRVTLPVETFDAKLASLPEGVSVSRDRIEVRFSGAKEAVGRLYALAHALVNDYERFEALVDGERRVAGERCRNERGAGAGGRGAGGRRRQGRGTRPAAGDRRRGAGCRRAVPGILRGTDREREDAGSVRAGGGAVLAWCEARGLGLRSVSPLT